MRDFDSGAKLEVLNALFTGSDRPHRVPKTGISTLANGDTAFLGAGDIFVLKKSATSPSKPPSRSSGPSR